MCAIKSRLPAQIQSFEQSIMEEWAMNSTTLAHLSYAEKYRKLHCNNFMTKSLQARVEMHPVNQEFEFDIRTHFLCELQSSGYGGKNYYNITKLNELNLACGSPDGSSAPEGSTTPSDVKHFKICTKLPTPEGCLMVDQNGQLGTYTRPDTGVVSGAVGHDSDQDGCITATGGPNTGQRGRRIRTPGLRPAGHATTMDVLGRFHASTPRRKAPNQWRHWWWTRRARTPGLRPAGAGYATIMDVSGLSHAWTPRRKAPNQRRDGVAAHWWRTGAGRDARCGAGGDPGRRSGGARWWTWAGGHQGRNRSDGGGGRRTRTESGPSPEQRGFGNHHDVYGPEGPRRS
jgi:hypothetical protein